MENTCHLLLRSRARLESLRASAIFPPRQMPEKLHQFAADLHATLYTKGERELRQQHYSNYALCFDLCNLIADYCTRIHSNTLGTPPSAVAPTESDKQNT